MEEELEKEIQRYNEEQDGDCRYVQTARHFARWMREQMMKDAVEGKVIDAGLFATYYTPIELTIPGQRVKIIIVEEDKQ